MEDKLWSLEKVRYPLARTNRRVLVRHVQNVSEATLVADLKQCGELRDLRGGKLLHSRIGEAGCLWSRHVAVALMNMYRKCGSMQDAREVFESMIQRDVVSWTALILGYVENGESLAALEVFDAMDCAPDGFTFVAALRACATLAKQDKKTSQCKGMAIHRQAREQGFDKNVFVASTLVDMYSKFGDMLQARDVFDGMMHRSVVSWTALIRGYVENGESFVALDLFNAMDCAPNGVTFVVALKACLGMATNGKFDKKTCLLNGVKIHTQARKRGFDKDSFVAGTLVEMYTKCGDMIQARDVFNGMTRQSVVSWTVLLLGYVENGQSSVALDLFDSMDCAPNEHTFVVALKACAALATDNLLDRGVCLRRGLAIHEQARERGFDNNVFVASTLVDMYSKCGDMVKARDVFDKMTNRSVVSWNVLILGYVENGESVVALDVFSCMSHEPDSITYVAAFKACATLAGEDKLDKKSCIEKGISIHKQAREHGFDRHLFVGNTLIDMYSKCGDMIQARQIFHRMKQRDVVSWNALLHGYVENGKGLDALEVFNSMDCAPNRGTFVAALKACADLAADNRLCKEAWLQKGLSIHRQARDCGFDKDVYVASTLVDMYGKCSDMSHAREVFEGMIHRNAVSWNALILGYVENGESLVALDVFSAMDCPPDNITFVAASKACAALAMDIKEEKDACLEKGVAIHKQAREYGFDKDVIVANSLVDMYSKCGDMLQARNVFDSMKHKTIVSWTALILGYVESGDSSMALDMFNNMDCVPDAITFVAVLKACGTLGAVETGQKIHDQVCELGMEEQGMVASSLVDFYGKCGNMAAAEDVFNRMPCRDIVAWSALLGGYSLHGDTSQVFSVIKRMEEADLQMNNVTMLLVLTACNHAGMVEEGQRYFESISDYGFKPTVEHYTCMVDMLGRANRLQEALSLVRDMPIEAGSPLWMSVLGACVKWRNLEIGKVAFSALVAQNDKDYVATAYVLMRNIYESLGMQQEVGREGRPSF